MPNIRKAGKHQRKAKINVKPLSEKLAFEFEQQDEFFIFSSIFLSTF